MEKILSKEDNWRLGFHLMPPVGWMNDPNGLCWYQGEYHVFFQYCPESANNGLSRWGHYVSRDLLNWQFLGIGVEADTPWETDGAYSGCAFVEQDVMHLFYTGNVKQPGDFDYILRGREANTIHAVSRDGRSVEGKECVMRNADYGSRYSCHVRDPKVWKEADTYYMVQGGRTKEGTGEVLLFSSK
ncbi:MAG: glycosyl hydrolase family 32, partial [Suipraeoptans intestinalis]|nr:glycosyl hydrolase family 32 [Suipraeoptans intestinalis]